MSRIRNDVVNRVGRGFVLALLVVVVAPLDVARAEPRHVLRLASVAPEGSAWAREFATFVNEVERGTNGEVKIKLFLGGVAGEELEVGERIAKGQLDGTLSGGILCTKIAPSMRVARIPGVFQSRDEAIHVSSELMPDLRKEAHAAGYELLGVAGIGNSVLFTRTPVRSMADLRKLTLWRWRDDQVAWMTNREMGLKLRPMGLRDAGRAFDDGLVDGFYAVPAATLVFQWYTQVSYMVDLPGDYLLGCVVLRKAAMDLLSLEHQEVMRVAGATMAVRFDEVGRRQDKALLGGIFQKRGVKKLAVSDKFRAEFFQSARGARKRLGDKLVDRALLDRVLRLLADYRAEHD
jgi:TRAP-type C4-dicarboxylate transport system substrate-binding protein